MDRYAVSFCVPHGVTVGGFRGIRLGFDALFSVRRWGCLWTEDLDARAVLNSASHITESRMEFGLLRRAILRMGMILQRHRSFRNDGLRFLCNFYAILVLSLIFFKKNCIIFMLFL